MAVTLPVSFWYQYPSRILPARRGNYHPAAEGGAQVAQGYKSPKWSGILPVSFRRAESPGLPQFLTESPGRASVMLLLAGLLTSLLMGMLTGLLARILMGLLSFRYPSGILPVSLWYPCGVQVKMRVHKLT